MISIPAAIRARIVDPARNRCEYCGLSQVGQEAAFHIDHVVPRKEGGPTSEENLALACVGCSIHKAAATTGIDPGSSEPTQLFNPRVQKWSEHFRWAGGPIFGLTACGRATVAALRMNRLRAAAIRAEEIKRGRQPPDV